MNEQAWKEQAARVMHDHSNPDDIRDFSERSVPLQDVYRRYASAIYPLVQQAIAAERGEPVAWMYTSVFGTEICRFRWGTDEGLTSDHWVGWTETPLYTAPSTEAQICADERERCAKVGRTAVLATQVSQLEISYRAYNCLRKFEVITLGDVMALLDDYPVSRLQAIPGVGKKMEMEVVGAVTAAIQSLLLGLPLGEPARLYGQPKP